MSDSYTRADWREKAAASYVAHKSLRDIAEKAGVSFQRIQQALSDDIRDLRRSVIPIDSVETVYRELLAWFQEGKQPSPVLRRALQECGVDFHHPSRRIPGLWRCGVCGTFVPLSERSGSTGNGKGTRCRICNARMKREWEAKKVDHGVYLVSTAAGLKFGRTQNLDRRLRDYWIHGKVEAIFTRVGLSGPQASDLEDRAREWAAPQTLFGRREWVKDTPANRQALTTLLAS